jgi:hypothetical protein
MLVSEKVPTDRFLRDSGRTIGYECDKIFPNSHLSLSIKHLVGFIPYQWLQIIIMALLPISPF